MNERNYSTHVLCIAYHINRTLRARNFCIELKKERERMKHNHNKREENLHKPSI